MAGIVDEHGQWSTAGRVDTQHAYGRVDHITGRATVVNSRAHLTVAYSRRRRAQTHMRLLHHGDQTLAEDLHPSRVHLTAILEKDAGGTGMGVGARDHDVVGRDTGCDFERGARPCHKVAIQPQQVAGKDSDCCESVFENQGAGI